MKSRIPTDHGIPGTCAIARVATRAMARVAAHSTSSAAF